MTRRTLAVLAVALPAMFPTSCTYNTYDVVGTSEGGTVPGDSGTGTPPNVNLFLQDVLAPPQGAGPGPLMCIFTADPTQAPLSKGILDVEVVKLFSDTYEAVFLAGNQFAAKGSPSAPQVDASRIEIQGATVKVTDATGKQLSAFSTHGAGFLNPSNNTTPGYGEVQFTIVDPATIDTLRSQLAPYERTTITTYTQALGHTLGGESVASNVFQFSITACKGCLVQFDTNTAKTPTPNCFGRAPPSGPSVCFFGQDAPVDCHVCSSKDPFCMCGRTSCP